MKRYLLNLSLISSFVLLGSLLLSEKTFSDDFIIHKTIETHYRKVAWNIKFMEERKSKLNNSTIFLGSSIVQGGINDSLLNSVGINSINMGVPHNGNELSLYFQERILKLAKPKKIIYLKGKVPYSGLHKLTPLLYTSSGLIKIGQTINLDYINFLFKKSKLSLEYFFYSLKKNRSPNTDNEKSFLKKEYGQINNSNVIANDDYKKYVGELQKFPNEDEKFNLYLNGHLYQKERDEPTLYKNLKILKRKSVQTILDNNFLFNRENQQKFMERAISEAITKNVDAEKVYIPILIDTGLNYGYSRKDYKELPSDNIGVLHLNDHSFLNQRMFWEDRDHLNISGSNIFTKRLVHLLE